MAQRVRQAAGMLLLAVCGATAWAQMPVPAAGRMVAVADDRSAAAADYERGFADGLNAKAQAERSSSAYRDGYRGGQTKHRTNELRPSGRDYARGYREGYNEPGATGKPKEAKNTAYVDGHRAGMADRDKLRARATTATTAASPAPTSADNMVGRPASSVDRDMKALGFMRISGFKKGSESFSTWQSRAQNRCVRLMAREGRVKELTNLDNDRCN